MKSNVSPPRASRLLHLLLLATLKPWLFWRYRVRITGERHLSFMKPPFVVVSNHANFWDPFLVAFAFRHPVHLVAADGNYRSRIMRFLMRLGGAIPKAKARNDMESIRAMQALIRNRHAIGFFPEGQRTWDGRTRPLLPGAEKLVRILGAPVVAVRLKGAYLSKPRWADSFRRGVVEIELSLLLPRPDIEASPRRELAVRIEKALEHDDHLWQAERQRAARGSTNRRQTGPRPLFVGKNRAAGAETVLFLCPVCGGWDTHRSDGEHIRCTACGAQARFLPSGTLQGAPFVYLSDWNAFQLKRLHEFTRGGNGELATGLAAEPAPLPCISPAASLLTGFRSRPLRLRGSVRVEMTRDFLTLTLTPVDTVAPEGAPGPLQHPTRLPPRGIPLREISGITVQYTHQLEFYARGTLYVLRIRPPGPSAYRFEQTILAINAAVPAPTLPQGK